MAKLSKFQIGAVRLTKLNYEVNEAFDIELFEEGIGLQPELETDLFKHPEDHVALVTLTLKISGEPKKVPIRFEAQNQMLLKFPADFEGTEEELDSFLSSTGTFHLLSFLRPIVSQLTGMSMLPALVLPLMDVSSMECKKRKRIVKKKAE